MKKIIMVSFLSLAFAASAFAANGSSDFSNACGAISNNAAQIFGGVDAEAAKEVTTPLIKMSNGVKGAVNGTTTQYVIVTKHTSGSKTFGTAGDTTSIFWTQDAKGDLNPAKCTDASNAANFTAAAKWTAQ